MRGRSIEPFWLKYERLPGVAARAAEIIDRYTPAVVRAIRQLERQSPGVDVSIQAWWKFYKAAYEAAKNDNYTWPMFSRALNWGALTSIRSKQYRDIGQPLEEEEILTYMDS